MNSTLELSSSDKDDMGLFPQRAAISSNGRMASNINRGSQEHLWDESNKLGCGWTVLVEIVRLAAALIPNILNNAN
jgi:hypothetical protein